MMKFQKIVMFMFLMTISFAPMLVEGQYTPPAAGQYNTYAPEGGKNAITVAIIEISRWILTFVGALSVLFIVIGGVMYIISAGGDTERAKNMIFNAIIGLTVALLGYAIVYVIGGFLQKG